jgi:hypothetical protein
LARSIDKLPPDFVCKLDYRDEVAYTESKAHREVDCYSVFAVSRKIKERKKFVMSVCKAI